VFNGDVHEALVPGGHCRDRSTLQTARRRRPRKVRVTRRVLRRDRVGGSSLRRFTCSGRRRWHPAGQAALFLADAGSAVTIVIRGPDLAASMSRYLVDRIEADARIVVRRNTRIVAVEGDDFLTGIRISGPGGEEILATTALFSFIGADPASQWLSGCAALDDRGFVLTDRSLGRDPLPFETSHPGLFAVGDVRSGSTKRVAAAVGEGSAAVRSVHEYVAFNPSA
jgi:thioredoxin reductase (NADPH)